MDPVTIPRSIVDEYRRFHGKNPDAGATRRRGFWPGPMRAIGAGVTIGYGIVDPQSDKEARVKYVHDFGAKVTVWKRSTVEKADKDFTWKAPKAVWILGRFLGLSYRDDRGRVVEVKGKSGEKLAWFGKRKALIVLGARGVELVAQGGKMRVTDWIRD